MRFDQGGGDAMRAPPLTAFRRQEYVRAILEGGPETKFTPLGVREWDAAGLTREVRRLSGLTPAALIASRSSNAALRSTPQR